jgi:hypothetical protein
MHTSINEAIHKTSSTGSNADKPKKTIKFAAEVDEKEVEKEHKIEEK